MNKSWDLTGGDSLHVTINSPDSIDIGRTVSRHDGLRYKKSSRRIKQGVSADHALEYFYRVRGHKHYPRDVISQAETFIKESTL
jgi:hypothetical protein